MQSHPTWNMDTLRIQNNTLKQNNEAKIMNSTLWGLSLASE